jgi:hypothetical protein
MVKLTVRELFDSIRLPYLVFSNMDPEPKGLGIDYHTNHLVKLFTAR